MQPRQRAKYLSDPIAVTGSPAEPRCSIRRGCPKRLARVGEVRELWVLLQARKHTNAGVRHDELECTGRRGIGNNARLWVATVLVDIVLEFAQGAKHCRRVAARETGVHRGLLGAACPKVPLALILGRWIVVAQPKYAGTSAKLGAADGPMCNCVARKLRKRCIERGPGIGVKVSVRCHRHLDDWPDPAGPQDVDLSNRQQPAALSLPEQVVGGPEIPHDVPGRRSLRQVPPSSTSSMNLPIDVPHRCNDTATAAAASRPTCISGGECPPKSSVLGVAPCA
jgi:hypothetical protein